MPTVAIVDGVTIAVYANDHPPAHFHAKFAEHQAVFDVRTLEMVRGSIPPAKKRRVLQWAQTRKVELSRAFDRVRAKQHVEPIE